MHANTDRDSGQLKQRLDEHLLGVALHSRKIAGTCHAWSDNYRALPGTRASPAGSSSRASAGRTRPTTARWPRREQAMEHGFFGLNLASTGCGKTLANGRILYALADPQRGARFSIASACAA
ncbi:hypothetical protein P4056_11325 [Pseudomonas aeruginosa]|nr:hypothetical protein [Pseudomonas aeruginosa]